MEFLLADSVKDEFIPDEDVQVIKMVEEQAAMVEVVIPTGAKTSANTEIKEMVEQTTAKAEVFAPTVATNEADANIEAADDSTVKEQKLTITSQEKPTEKKLKRRKKPSVPFEELPGARFASLPRPSEVPCRVYKQKPKKPKGHFGQTPEQLAKALAEQEALFASAARKYSTPGSPTHG